MQPEDQKPTVLAVKDLMDLLQSQFVIYTGGKAKDGCPIVTFPDNINFHMLSDSDYERLILYLTSVLSMQEADLGFHIVIDRRKDRWSYVKSALLKISAYFPGLIQVVYVVRPESFLQKALSEVSNKLCKEEFKFRFVILSTSEELFEYIEPSQLTTELGGTLQYSHEDWIQQRISVEKFSELTNDISNSLYNFTKRINDTEFPNTVDSTQQLLNQQELSYNELKEGILLAAKHGEVLLFSIRDKPHTTSPEGSGSPSHTYTIGNVFAVERLLVQLEETERTFDEFWQKHAARLRQCLELRRFEQDFRELQSNFDSYLKTVSEMTELGETSDRVDTLIRETASFQKMCKMDIERAEEVIATGKLILTNRSACTLECIEPKCFELTRVTELLSDKLSKRMEYLVKCKELMERVEKANKWCTKGIDLLASQQIEKCSQSTELAEQFLTEILEFVSSAGEFKLDSPREFRSMFQDSITPETKALVTQVLQRIDDVSLMCDKRIANLKKLSIKSPRPVQSVTPKPALPLQPSGGAPHPSKGVLKKGNTVPLLKVNIGTETQPEDPNSSPECDILHDDEKKAKRGHVLTELLKTERIYVLEMKSILMGYKHQINNQEMHAIVPDGLAEKAEVLFGNLEEIFAFHADIFLKDLENCSTSPDLVALCFVQRRDIFYHLYSYYCQNIPRSENFRESLVDNHKFFQTCQNKLGHKLPLAAYLLKPVQRITKYQLLLKDLLRYSDDSICCKELQQALDCMLVVLKLVNDSMHQVAITGFPIDLSQQGDLLLEGSFSVWIDNKKDLRLRLKPMQRHIFFYEKVMLLCKQTTKTNHNKVTYNFKHHLNMSQVGLTESVKGDTRKFEIWLQGRQEVYIIQAATVEQKQTWVNKIKKVLINQLEELKGEKIKQYPSLIHRPIRQTNSWEKPQKIMVPLCTAMSVDSDCRSSTNNEVSENTTWYSDCSNSEDEDMIIDHHSTSFVQNGRYAALADYCAAGNSEVSFREGDLLELWKVGCAGWWFVKVVGTGAEGWAPAAYLDAIHQKNFRSSSKSQDRLSN